MKKYLLMILGMLLIAATVEAGCGSCPGDKKAAAKAKASVCDIKGTCKADVVKDKVESEIKAVKKCGPNCKKPCCAAKKIKDNASEKAQEVRKKWWKFGFGE